mmetsp:Transcript_10406/g.36534  ORF Transcript_10406/g.36534 Transcript_10406/m.36534 type:complete len:209 (+) Transcript_10406:361-987(+)
MLKYSLLSRPAASDAGMPSRPCGLTTPFLCAGTWRAAMPASEAGMPSRPCGLTTPFLCAGTCRAAMPASDAGMPSRTALGAATPTATLLMHLGPCRHTYRSTGLDRALDCPMPLLVRARIDRRARASRRGAGPRGGTGKRSAQRTVGGRISWRMTCRNATGRTRSVHAHQPGIQFEGRRAACQRERGARIVPDWRRMRHLLLGAESPD